MIARYLDDPDVAVVHGDALEALRTFEEGSFDACITSPPYLEARPEYETVSPPYLEDVFRELGRVVDGTLLVNVGRLWRNGDELLWWLDVIARAEFAGWTLRDTVVWAKPNPNPIQGSILTNAHEYVFLFGDGFTPDAVRLPYAEGSIERLGRRHLSHLGVKGDLTPGFPTRSARQIEEAGRRQYEPNPDGARAPSVFVTSTGAEKGNPHPAPMPLRLAEWLVELSGGSRIVDPFAGSGTTLLAARNCGKDAVGVEREVLYCELIASRLSQQRLGV